MGTNTHGNTLEAGLKQDMIRQGKSAEEIVMVLKASKSEVEEEETYLPGARHGIFPR